jgi:hypothetical protein
MARPEHGRISAVVGIIYNPAQSDGRLVFRLNAAYGDDGDDDANVPQWLLVSSRTRKYARA